MMASANPGDLPALTARLAAAVALVAAPADQSAMAQVAREPNAQGTAAGSSAHVLNPLPTGFAERVAKGWLPDLCVRPSDPGIPAPRLRAWARPRDGKRVRVLFICNSEQQYEALSVAHAFDLECDILPWWRSCSWKENDADPDTMNLLRHYLGTRRYDVIAMASAWLSALPDDCERKIAELIREQGIGFVYALPGVFPRVPAMWGKPSPILDPLLPITLDRSGYKAVSHQVLAGDPHPLSRGVDFARLQWTCNTDGAVVSEATVLLRCEHPNRALAAAVTRGNGRVVAYNRCYGEHTYGYPFLPVVDCPGSEAETGKRCRWLGQEEAENQFYNWLGRALLWAARAEPPSAIASVSVSAAGTTHTVTVVNRGTERTTLRLRGLVRSRYGTVRKPLAHTWSITGGEAEARTFPLPDTGRQGAHLLDLSLASADGKVRDWYSVPFDVPGPLQVTLDPDFELHQPDEEAKVNVRVSGLPAGTPFSLRTELFDLQGRLLVDQQRTARAAAGRAPVTELVRLKPTRIATALANVRVTVAADGAAVEVRDQLFVRQDPHWEQFHIKAYGSCGHNLLCSDVMIDTLKRSGHDTVLYAFVNPFRARINTETGMRCAAGHVSSCRRYDSERIRELVRWLRKFSPVVYEQQDEPELQVTPAAEARFGDAGNMQRFRTWLQVRYGTVESLNQSWRTRYAKWEDVQRVVWHEVEDTPNWAPWFDSRRDLDRGFVDRYDRCARAIHEVEPDRFCPINPRSVCTFGGVNLRELTRRLRASSLYNHFVARPPMGYLELGAQWVEFAQTCAGYSWPSQPNPDGLAREAWDTVRHGVNQLAWFAPFCDETPPRGRFSYLAGNYTLNEKGKAVARINHQLLAGPGDVAVNTAPVDDGVFVYYPRSLFYTHTLAFMAKQRRNDPTLDPATMTGLGPWKEQLPNSFVPSMRALGFQFQFGDEADMAAERLGMTRVVFLSHVVCLGPRELELLRGFVKAGGCVVAEAGTARRDGDGRLYEQTPAAFREVFGVERSAPNPSPIVGMDRVVACGARRIAGVSPQLGVAYQNGRAFFLDFVVPASAEGHLVVRRLMNLAGLRPTYALAAGNIERESIVASLFARRLGDSTWLYVLGEGQARRRFEIELPQPRYVYEMTAGRGLGRLSSIQDELRYGEARVFALSPMPPGALHVEPDRTTSRPGSVVRLNCVLNGQGGAVGERLFRVECAGPKGSPLPSIPRLIRAPDGRAELPFFIPLNAAPGTLELTVVDLASGVRSQSKISVSPRPAAKAPGF